MKNIVKTIALTVLFNGIAFTCLAQMGMGKVEEIMAVKSRKLIVIVEEPQERIIKKLTKKKKETEIEQYRATLEKYNYEMREVAEKFWPYKENGFEYKTFEEVKRLKKDKNKEYAVLYCVSQRPSSFNSGYVSSDGLEWWAISDEDAANFNDCFVTMIVNQIEDLERRPVYSTPLPDMFPTKAGLVFGITSTANYFDYRIRKKMKGEKVDQQEMVDEQVKENAPKLKEMNLLIRKDLLNKDLPENAISKYYPYKYTVCSKDDIDNAIMNQQDQTAYIMILPLIVSNSNNNSVMYIHYIFDAKTNQLMAYIKPSVGSLLLSGMGGGMAAGKRTIEKVNMEKFAGIINGKK